MRISKQIATTTVVLFSVIFLSACDGYQGKAYERMPDGSIGPTIPGVNITFTSESGSVTKTATTNSSGYYKIRLTPQRYVVTATHPGYASYNSSPGFFVVTGDGYQTGNIFLKKSIDVAMISTSLLNKDADFNQAIEQYKTALLATEGLGAEYIELDSDETLATYGLKVNDPTDWNEVRNVLQQVLQVTHSSYIMILGGPQVVPRPVANACCDDAGAQVSVPSDAWYVDFNNDQIVDEGLSIGRLTELSHNASAVTDALQTVTAIHNAGGYTLNSEVKFGINDYTTPPYGVCDTCSEQAAFFNLMSTHDYIVFAGHGSPTAFYSNTYDLKFSVDYFGSVDLQTHHPVVIAYFPCSAGGIFDNSTSLAYEFMKAGAAAYLARTTTHGVPAYVASNVQPDIEGGMRIGPALFKSMRDSALAVDNFKNNAIQINLYGDPTLKRQ